MLFTGFYMTWASLLCLFGMVLDLLRGLHRRKLWFPCGYFGLSSASISAIGVAVQQSMDLNDNLPDDVDQMAKLGGMAFMCTMMANSLPSLTTIDSDEIKTNIIALGVLVIQLVVDVYHQIKTGVYDSHNRSIAEIFMAAMIMLLIAHASSATMILTSKQILESKYQQGQETDMKNQELQTPGSLTIDKLKQHVSKYWIMAGTGSPQFMIACSATGAASGVICAFTSIIHVVNMLSFFTKGSTMEYESEYKWAASAVLLTQFVGVVLGTIAPILRCFAGLNFEVSVRWISYHVNVFEVENYWTQRLYDLKKSKMPEPFLSRKSQIVIYKMQMLVLGFYILLQKTVVVTFKIVGLIPIFFVICVLYCSHCWKWLMGVFVGSSQQYKDTGDDLQHYVLHDTELAECTLNGLSKSVGTLMQPFKKRSTENIMKLLRRSKGFNGVEKFDSPRVPSLLSEERHNCWSLSLVTLTTIAISLPNIPKKKVESLLRSVSAGLVYVRLVEESLNDNDEYIDVQQAAKTLWIEVVIYNR